MNLEQLRAKRNELAGAMSAIADLEAEGAELTDDQETEFTEAEAELFEGMRGGVPTGFDAPERFTGYCGFGADVDCAPTRASRIEADRLSSRVGYGVRGE